MTTINTFELIFDITVEKFEGKIRDITKKIKIDGVEINSKNHFSLPILVDSLYLEGEHFIFTCGCGNPGCAQIDKGIIVSLDKNFIHWQVRDPIRSLGYDNYDDWNAKAKTINYSFNKKLMIDNISQGIDEIKKRTDNNAEFLFILTTYLSLWNH